MGHPSASRQSPLEAPRRVGWEGRIARGFRLGRVSWEVLERDRRLLALPLAAAVCALLAILATAALARRLQDAPDLVRVVGPVWAAAYAVSFVTIFFNVALVHVVVQRWRGAPAGLMAGIAAACARAPAIAGWAVVTTTVGLVLRLVERLTLGVSQIVLGIVAGVAWSVASFLVVPVLVVERRGPLRSLRRSAAIVRERWADGLGGATPIALATLVVLLPVLGLVFIGAVLYATGLTAPGTLAMTVAAAAGLVVWIVSVALSQVFTLAVFQHATGGPFYAGFPAADLERPRDGNARRALRRLRSRRS